MKGKRRSMDAKLPSRLTLFSCIPPYRIDTLAATAAVEKATESKVLHLKHAEVCRLNL